MCGIVGYAGWARVPEASEAELTTMCAAIRHRGPDEEGHFVGPGIALGMRRLSVMDPANGSQPMANEDGSVQVVYNGEIYNHELLRAELAPGHKLRTRADTEVLAHLYEEDGPDMVRRLRGMFAFALWDDSRQRLLLARDRLGIKPLYYWETGTGVGFASELKSLLVLKDRPATIDVDALRDYLALGYVPDPRSIFVGVRKLPPGHILTWCRAEGLMIREYWNPVRPELPVADPREAVEELRRLLAESVRMHLMSDVRLGAFLSGGIDSSTVVAYMARAMTAPVETFSIGFDEEEFNEAPHAARVAKELRTKHTELIVRPDAESLIDELTETFDEPFGDASALPTLLVSRLARQSVTVALSGDGGDELFGGYTRYAELERVAYVGPALARQALGALARRLPLATYGRNTLLDLSRGVRGKYAGRVAQALERDEGGLLRNVPRGHSLDHLMDRWFDRSEGRDLVTQLTLVDMVSYLPGDILTKVDRTSMRVSLETRVPLLDHLLVEFAVALPGRFKRRDGQGKWILREAIRGIVPDSVLEQPKRGFALPLGRWMRTELRHRLETLMDTDRPVYQYVDHASVKATIEEHLRGRRDHSHQIWRIMALDLWLGRWLRPR